MVEIGKCQSIVCDVQSVNEHKGLDGFQTGFPRSGYHVHVFE